MSIKIADAHTHIYPAKIADKATAAIGDFYDISMDKVGTSKELIENGNVIGVDKYLVCSAATTPKQVESINNFLYEEGKEHPEFIVLGSMHKDYEDYKTELKRMKDMGFSGVKFHPDFQKFDIDDEAMFPIYEECEKLGFVVLFHMGDNRYDYSKPERLCNVIRRIPKLKCIGAHFGGYHDWEQALIHYTKLFEDGFGENLYFDTSSSLFKLDIKTADLMIEKFGYERFMFGSDFPMWKHDEELERFNKLSLTDEQREAILYKNFEKLFLL